jgi:hypothetical protein
MGDTRDVASVTSMRRGGAAHEDGAAGRTDPSRGRGAATVASGGSNPETPAALFLSEKTVARHLSNIFTKTRDVAHRRRHLRAPSRRGLTDRLRELNASGVVPSALTGAKLT